MPGGSTSTSRTKSHSQPRSGSSGKVYYDGDALPSRGQQRLIHVKPKASKHTETSPALTPAATSAQTKDAVELPLGETPVGASNPPVELAPLPSVTIAIPVPVSDVIDLVAESGGSEAEVQVALEPNPEPTPKPRSSSADRLLGPSRTTKSYRVSSPSVSAALQSAHSQHSLSPVAVEAQQHGNESAGDIVFISDSRGTLPSAGEADSGVGKKRKRTREGTEVGSLNLSNAPVNVKKGSQKHQANSASTSDNAPVDTSEGSQNTNGRSASTSTPSSASGSKSKPTASSSKSKKSKLSTNQGDENDNGDKKKKKKRARGQWPEGDTSYFCHHCRNGSKRLRMRCSNKCNMNYCVRCITVLYALFFTFACELFSLY